ncbi:MAG: hypothetical protein ABL927_13310 [Bdellovibrionales bacterium]
MNINTLISLIEIRGLKPAEVARRAGISRQVISLWKKKSKGSSKRKFGPLNLNEYKIANVNVYSQIQEALASTLGVQTADLSRPLAILATPEKRQEIEAAILWDKLYPNIETFCAVLIKGDLVALARLVQVYGLYAAAKMVGQQIWVKFPKYKNKIHPAYRKQLEVVWTLYQNPV